MTRAQAGGTGIAILLVVLAGSVAARKTVEPLVPTHTVTRGRFLNEVLADGLLHAVHSTVVGVPAEHRRSMRVAWLAPPGVVKTGDVLVRFDPSEVEREYQDGSSDRQSAANRKDKARIEGDRATETLRLDRDLVHDELERAEDVSVTDETIFSRNEILDSRIDRTLLRKRLDATDAKRGPTKRLAETDAALAEIERRKADIRMTQAERSLKALSILAPHDGILVFPMSWRGDAIAVGDTVWPGQPIAELPDLSALEARVFVLEGDAAGLSTELSVRLEIEGQPGRALDGKVTRVDALAKNKTRESPVKYFETTIGFERSASRALKPGQRVKATIVMADRADVLWIPRGALFERDGRRYVYRQQGGSFQAVDVGVGARSLGKVVIERGLTPGDRVALRDPQEERTTKPPRDSPGIQTSGPTAKGR